MHPLLIPAMLLLASLSQRSGGALSPRPLSPPGGAPKPRTRTQAQRRPSATDRPMPASQARPARPKQVQIDHAPEHPDVMPAPPEEQAAVDAAMATVVKKLQAAELPQPTGAATNRTQNVPVPADALRDPFVPPRTVEPEPVPPVASLSELERVQKAAAQKLLSFLLKTGRFGTLAHDTKSKKDRPQEIKNAQKVLRVTPDGIVGPKTRAAAAAVGVALPERPK